jgi:hypothetical protein
MAIKTIQRLQVGQAKHHDRQVAAITHDLISKPTDSQSIKA